jgi:cellulose synthase/poly-beta-1,6-N-acetylglucosamine synthase-like glycosyltransferase
LSLLSYQDAADPSVATGGMDSLGVATASAGKNWRASFEETLSSRRCHSDDLVRFRRAGIAAHLVDAARRRSWSNGSTLVAELVAIGALTEAAYYREVARDLNVEFLEIVDPHDLILSGGHQVETIRAAGAVRCLGKRGVTYTLLTPSQSQIGVTLKALEKSPELASFIKVTTPSAFEKAVLERLAADKVRECVNQMPLEIPHFSAKNVLVPWQGFALGMLVVILPLLAFWSASTFLILVHLLASLLFAGCVLIRVRAAKTARPALNFSCRGIEGPFPVYSVMIALYDEADLVPQIVSCIRKLDWPASRLDVMFICEDADPGTRTALQAALSGTTFRIISVPAYGPQTKPRALRYALPLAKGEFVVVYDAEDRPHPGQLMEAYSTFQKEPMETACLQSPLSISNGASSCLARMFAFEYGALFQGLLPYLAQHARFLPLGGTSNHFRRSVLNDIGAWDPYNVTEDADLGTRLYRLGYRVKMLSLPTLEDAPEHFRHWLPQRTRWFKGWFQTWLVHMRDPARLYRQVGLTNFMIFHWLTIGMILSAAIYPFMLVEMAWLSASIIILPHHNLTQFGLAMFVIDFANVTLGHLGFIALGTSVARPKKTFDLVSVTLLLPWYWTLQSIAAWRALWQLFNKPHFWEKTPHFPNTGQAGIS